MSHSLLTHLLSAALFCGFCSSALAGDDLITELKERLLKEKAKHSTKGKPAKPATAFKTEDPQVPMTWEQFLEANQNKGVTRSDLARRFRVADANQNGILTPAEVQEHRKTAARNKAKRR